MVVAAAATGFCRALVQVPDVNCIARAVGRATVAVSRQSTENAVERKADDQALEEQDGNVCEPLGPGGGRMERRSWCCRRLGVMVERTVNCLAVWEESVKLVAVSLVLL